MNRTRSRLLGLLREHSISREGDLDISGAIRKLEHLDRATIYAIVIGATASLGMEREVPDAEVETITDALYYCTGLDASHLLRQIITDPTFLDRSQRQTIAILRVAIDRDAKIPTQTLVEIGIKAPHLTLLALSGVLEAGGDIRPLIAALPEDAHTLGWARFMLKTSPVVCLAELEEAATTASVRQMLQRLQKETKP